MASKNQGTAKQNSSHAGDTTASGRAGNATGGECDAADGGGDHLGDAGG
jgi:hypothetical protein